MLYYIVKVLISAALITLVSEVAKRSSVLGGFIASLPLVSLLGIIWLYVDTRNPAKVAALAADIFWLVLPSLVLFAVLPWLLKRFDFWPAMAVAALATCGAYGFVLWLLRLARTLERTG